MSFGELVLVLGDLHIPYRTSEIASKFRDLLVPDKIPTLVCTGNLCTTETLEYIKSIAPNVHCVRGDMDDPILHLPEELVFEIGDFRIGVIHGHQIVPWGDLDSLGAVARRLEVDVLISGHTHVNETVEWNGKCFINPGSLTGAFSPINSTAIKASFICMSVKADTITNYVYELIPNSGMVQKHKWSYTKGGGGNHSGNTTVMERSRLDASTKEARLFGATPSQAAIQQQPATTTKSPTMTTTTTAREMESDEKPMENIELQDDGVTTTPPATTQAAVMSIPTIEPHHTQEEEVEHESTDV